MMAFEMLAVLNDVEFNYCNSQSRHITTSSIYVTRMGESKGYCFITFANIESANAAPWDGLPIWGC